jgi:hypothetical protein
MRVEMIGGPLDGAIRVIHEGNVFVLVGQGEYRVETLMGLPLKREGEAVRAYWKPVAGDAP